MGDYDLRVPELGESLRRPRTPHLIPPEELRLDQLELGEPMPTRPSPADIVRAHEGDVEEPHGEEHHGPHGHIEVGIDGETGHPVTGRIGAGVEIPVGENVGIEAEAGVEGLGGSEVTGDVGGEVRIGPEAGTHGLLGVEAEHLGSEHPRIMGSAGVGFGDIGRLSLNGGATLGEHPSANLGIGGELQIAPWLRANANVGVDGLGGHPTGRIGGGLELDLNDRLSLTGGVEAEGLGGGHPSVTGSAGLRFRFP
jgi:hypothetical protein